MTRKDFIDKYKHQLAGFVVDAATAGRSGAELALFLRGVMQRIDANLGVIYDDLCPPAPLPVNGKPAQPPRT